jgi:ATP nucleosidase Cap17-like protein
MQIRGRRITIAGSAAPDVDATLLGYAHELIRHLVTSLFAEGALFSVGVGKEPRRIEDPSQSSVIFDWTVLETLGDRVAKARSSASTVQGKLIATITTDKTTNQIPDSRKALWSDLIAADSVLIRSVEPGWTSGAIRRQMQAELGDVLICISGGEGVEHLAKEFALQGKPVIPLDLQLGASTKDGTGGAGKLFGQMRAHPERFAPFTDLSSAGGLLTRIETRQGKEPVANVVNGMLTLIKALKPPKAFYVRLLNPKVADYAEVEDYFRKIIDPVVKDLGYEPIQMGKADATSPWMEVQIFEIIHNAGVVIVDLTGVRPNCFTEMGYAFGRARKVIVTAKEGTAVPFDTNTYEANMWNPAKNVADSMTELKEYWQRNISRPPLVIPRRIL